MAQCGRLSFQKWDDIAGAGAKKRALASLAARPCRISGNFSLDLWQSLSIEKWGDMWECGNSGRGLALGPTEPSFREMHISVGVCVIQRKSAERLDTRKYGAVLGLRSLLKRFERSCRKTL